MQGAYLGRGAVTGRKEDPRSRQFWGRRIQRDFSWVFTASSDNEISVSDHQFSSWSWRHKRQRPMGARDQLRTVPGLSPGPKSGYRGGEIAACNGAASPGTYQLHPKPGLSVPIASWVEVNAQHPCDYSSYMPAIWAGPAWSSKLRFACSRIVAYCQNQVITYRNIYIYIVVRVQLTNVLNIRQCYWNQGVHWAFRVCVLLKQA